MGARVGTPVTGSGTGNSTTVATVTKTTTTGNLQVVFVKWENAVTLTSVVNGSGETFTITERDYSGSPSEPRGAICWRANATGKVGDLFTATFSANAQYRAIIGCEYSGIATSSPLDGSVQTNQGTAVPYTTTGITTTTSGITVGYIGDYNGLTGESAAGTPTHSLLDTTLSDNFAIDLISGSAQTCTPSASVSTGVTRWVMLYAAFKDAGAPAAVFNDAWDVKTPIMISKARVVASGLTPSDLINR